MGKLTDAQRKALLFYERNEGAKFFPIAIRTATILQLASKGFLRSEQPQFGFRRYFITPAGRAALQESNNDA